MDQRAPFIARVDPLRIDNSRPWIYALSVNRSVHSHRGRPGVKERRDILTPSSNFQHLHCKRCKSDLALDFAEARRQVALAKREGNFDQYLRQTVDEMKGVKKARLADAFAVIKATVNGEKMLNSIASRKGRRQFDIAAEIEAQDLYISKKWQDLAHHQGLANHPDWALEISKSKDSSAKDCLSSNPAVKDALPVLKELTAVARSSRQNKHPNPLSAPV